MTESGSGSGTRITELASRLGVTGLFFVGLAVFLLASTAALTWARLAPSEDTRQPIAFNHRIHVEDNGMACSECHESYEKETFSGLPSAELCGFCHAEAQGESAEEARLVGMLEEGTQLEWKRLFRQPPHVFYSHRRHVTVAGLECETCHGSIAETETPPRSVVTLTMDDCLDCHREQGASEDCTSCHR